MKWVAFPLNYIYLSNSHKTNLKSKLSFALESRLRASCITLGRIKLGKNSPREIILNSPRDLSHYSKLDQVHREEGRLRLREVDLSLLAHRALHLVSKKLYYNFISNLCWTSYLGTKNSRALIKTPKAAKNNSLL